MLKMKIVFFLVALGFAIAACQNGAAPKKELNDVPYTVAQHYFVNNTYSESGVKKITTQEEFDSIFGMAAVMGENGAPTAIDFKTSYVIAIIEDESNKTPQIMITSLKHIDGKVVLNYSAIENEETTYSTKPAAILIVDNRYQGEIKCEKK